MIRLIKSPLSVFIFACNLGQPFQSLKSPVFIFINLSARPFIQQSHSLIQFIRVLTERILVVEIFPNIMSMIFYIILRSRISDHIHDSGASVGFSSISGRIFFHQKNFQIWIFFFCCNCGRKSRQRSAYN